MKDAKDEQVDDTEQDNQSDEGMVANVHYEKAYNQLQNYKTENKALKKEMVKNQRRAELNIDYFVQL